MKDGEEVAPYCSEFDDYMDESQEILSDQGKAFPYSYGLHLVGQLVAAFNPHDLDAMDESVPFTQATLADLLGYELSLAEYKYYFDNFLEAQRKRLPTLEHYQKEFLAMLPKLYPEFRKVALASDIVEVRNYRRRLKADTPIIKLTTGQAPESSSPQSPRRWMRATNRQLQDSDSSQQSPRRLMRLFRENSLGRLFQGKQAKRMST
jgi:hypothetical protein